MRKSLGTPLEDFKFTRERKYPCCFFYHELGFSFVGNHQIMDGVSSFNVCQLMFDDGTEFKPISFTYLPIVSELGVIPSIPKYWHKVERRLRYGPDWLTHKDSVTETVYYKHELQHYKRLKSKQTMFASVVVAISIDTLFKIVSVNKLAIAVVVAFDGGKRFNNFGVILCEIDRRKRNETLVQ